MSQMHATRVALLTSHVGLEKLRATIEWQPFAPDEARVREATVPPFPAGICSCGTIRGSTVD